MERGVGAPRAENVQEYYMYVSMSTKSTKRRDDAIPLSKLCFFCGDVPTEPAWPMAALARPAPLVTSLEELEASKSHLMHSNLHIIMLASLSARFDA